MKKLIIIRGNSGSGKTSLAKRLQEELTPSCFLLSQDIVRREMLPGNDDRPLLLNLLRFGHENHGITILEGILTSDRYRAVFEAAVELYGNNIHAYYFDLPFDETLRRHATKDVRNEFGEPELRNWWREKDFIGFVTEALITEDVSLEKATLTILAEIHKI